MWRSFFIFQAVRTLKSTEAFRFHIFLFCLTSLMHLLRSSWSEYQSSELLYTDGWILQLLHANLLGYQDSCKTISNHRPPPVQHLPIDRDCKGIPWMPRRPSCQAHWTCDGGRHEMGTEQSPGKLLTISSQSQQDISSVQVQTSSDSKNRKLERVRTCNLLDSGKVAGSPSSPCSCLGISSVLQHHGRYLGIESHDSSI